MRSSLKLHQVAELTSHLKRDVYLRYASCLALPSEGRRNICNFTPFLLWYFGIIVLNYTVCSLPCCWQNTNLKPPNIPRKKFSFFGFDVTSNVSFLRGSNTQLRDVTAWSFTAGPLSDVTPHGRPDSRAPRPNQLPRPFSLVLNKLAVLENRNMK